MGDPLRRGRRGACRCRHAPSSGNVSDACVLGAGCGSDLSGCDRDGRAALSGRDLRAADPRECRAAFHACASETEVAELTVAHVVPAPFDPEEGIVGGAERYAFELARHMSERVTTRLVTFGATKRTAHVGRLEVLVLNDACYVRGQRTNPVAPAMLGALRGATVIHCHQQHVMASSLAAVFARLTGRRVFVTDLGGGGFDVS